MLLKARHICMFLVLIAFACSCAGRGCQCACASPEDQEPQASVQSKPITLAEREKYVEPADPKAEPVVRSNVKRIVIGPSTQSDLDKGDVEPALKDLASAGEIPLPKDAELSTSLTSRLRKKMLEAFAGEEWKAPDVKIYVSAQSLDDFTGYYESKGYKVQRISVPATDVIGPVLEQRPDLKDSISLKDYEDVTINQVMVEGLNVSAADKYIDPETYDIINKTFITSMPAR